MEDILTSLTAEAALLVLAALFALLVVLALVAIQQGREFSIWPPKLGPRISTDKDNPAYQLGPSSLGIEGILPSLDDLSSLFRPARALSYKRVRVLARSWHSTIHTVGEDLAKLRDASFYVLILDPESTFVEERVRENPYETAEKVRREINYTLDRLTELKQKYGLDRLVIKKYSMLPIFRMILIDDVAYLSYYPKGAPGTSVPVFKIRKGQDTFYQALDRFFEYVWSISDEVC